MKVQLSDHFTYKKLLRFIMPTVFMMLVTSVYSIVDGFFVSNFVGKNAFAAVNLVMPVLMMIGAFGFMIGTGGSALVAKTLGEGDKERANQIFSMLIMVIIIFALTVGIIVIIFMPQIVDLLGASSIIRDDCIVYGRISTSSMVFFMMQNSFQSFLVTANRSRLGLLFSVISGVNNMVMDFVLVYVLQYGIGGAALATAFSELLGGMMPFVYFISKKNKSQLKLVKTKIDFTPVARACSNGMSEMLTNISTSLVSVVYNYQLMRVAREDGISAYGVIMYVGFTFTAFFLGYAIGVNPIVGYNYGANRSRELKNVLKKSLVLTAIVAVIMFSVAVIFAPNIANIFVGYDKALMALTTNALRIYSFYLLFYGFNIFGSAFFTGLNNGKISAVISSVRTLGVQMVAIIVLPYIFGINGVWTAPTVAEIVTLFITIAFLVANKKKYNY